LLGCAINKTKYMSEKNLPEQTILGSAITPIVRVLELRGIDPKETLLSVGIDSTELERPGWRVPTDEYNQLMHRCVELTGDEAFGLHVAEVLQPQALHGLGLGWLASDTVYDGLRRLVRFCSLIASMSDVRLEEENDVVTLCIHSGHSLELDDFAYASRDYGVGLVVRMCQLTLGKYIAPVRIEMARPTPNDPSLWESMLSTRVSFEHDKTLIVFSKSDIDEILPTGDPALARLVDEQAAIYIDSFLDLSVAREVARKIIARLPDGPPGQDLVAGDMCMSQRTLQRKLKDEGTSFSDLLQDSRMQLSKRYLRQPGRSVVETSYLLGFAEPSAFSRAFKRWTGQTPAQYRDAKG
jgi:AraC-like DNA-binding protein